LVTFKDGRLRRFENPYHIIGVNMSKEKSAKKETKKAPAKSMKEKKLEKREKKAKK
jgi:hypothetical protein